MSSSEKWVYCDTSALAKRYVRETGHTTLRRTLARRRVVSSAVILVELHSAFANAVRSGRLATMAQPKLWAQIEKDREHWTLLEISADVRQAAQQLIETYPLRSLDAIHVASAKVFAMRLRTQILFVTADTRQLHAAASLGFETAKI
jgi:predicted nucleic acid-binding protein